MTHLVQAAPARRTLSLFGSAPRTRALPAIIPPAELRKLVAAMVD
jgi:hypothetical protein